MTKFQIGDKVTVSRDVQGFNASSHYRVIDIDINYTPFGGFTYYKLKSVHTGVEGWIANGHLLLEKYEVAL